MKKLSAILILTNQCNLKCSCCVYGCDLELKPYYITIKELQHTLNLMKQKIPSLERIMLSGGDALMHPLFIQICKEVRKFYPDIDLCAYTNGLLLNKILDRDILYLTKTLRLNIISSLYPSIENLKEYKKQDSRFKNLGIELYYQFSHFYFDKQIYIENNLQVPNQKINEHFYSKCKTLTKFNNLITIYKDKILVCCGEVGYINTGLGDISDLLDLNFLQSEQQIIDFCDVPHNICKICIANNQNNGKILWSSKNSTAEKYQMDNLKTVFIKNYSDYKKLYLDNQEHLICFNDIFFKSKISTLPPFLV